MHDIKRQMRDLGEALSQEKRHIALLVGAGCPVSIRVVDDYGNDLPLIPDVSGLTALVTERLRDDEQFRRIVRHFEEDGVCNPNIEHMLTHVRNLKRVAGAVGVRGIDSAGLAALEQTICERISEATFKLLPPGSNSAYHRVANWIASVPRNCPITIFTTNYDVLMEQALEEHEVPFFDGFSGSHRPFFDIRAMESDPLPNRWARLWKLHGSLSWRMIEDGRRTVFRTAGKDDALGTLLIHPSELKYDQSRRMPYLAMFDRLRTFLREPGAILVTCGYSFADEHINETLIEGLAANPSAAAFGLLFNPLQQEAAAGALASRVPRNFSLLARDKAVIRQIEADWWDPDAEDTPPPPCDHAEAENPAATFGLGDFAKFGGFLLGLAASHRTTTQELHDV